jgi:hypothetical protein
MSRFEATPSPAVELNRPSTEPRLAHPSLEDLAAYREGRLKEVLVEALRDHFVSCRQCTDLCLDLEDFATSARSAPSSEARREARLLVRALSAQRSAKKWRYPAFAAALLVLLGVGMLIHQQAVLRSLRRELVSTARPPSFEPNLTIRDLYSVGALRGPNASSLLEIPATASWIALILNVDALQDFPEYEIEILDANGRLVSTVRGLRSARFGTLSLGLPLNALPADDYLLRLFGRRPGAREPIDDFPLRLARYSVPGDP